MPTFILRRFFHSLLMIVGITIIVFLITNVFGDPVALLLDPLATREEADLLRKELGLDRPFYIQYLTFFGNVLRGDFGESLQARAPAMGLVLQHLPATIELTVASMAFMLLVGLPIGVLSATRPSSLVDRAGQMIALVGQAAPNYWLGVMAILVFGVQLKMMPISGRGGLEHLVLPALTLGTFGMAAVMRLTRSAMLDVLGKEYVSAARTRGFPEHLVVLKHALRNALIPVLTYVGQLLATLLGGAVITETIFAWPGVGRLAVQAISSNDFRVVQAVVVVASVIFIVVNLLVEILYSWIDP